MTTLRSCPSAYANMTCWNRGPLCSIALWVRADFNHLLPVCSVEHFGILPQWMTETELKGDLAPSLCVMAPPPLCSQRRRLKDKTGRRVCFFLPHLLIIPSFCVWCSSLCSPNKSCCPCPLIALPPKVWWTLRTSTSPVPAHYATVTHPSSDFH